MAAVNPKLHPLKRSALKRPMATDENAVATTIQEAYAGKQVHTSTTVIKPVLHAVSTRHDENIAPGQKKVVATTKNVLQVKHAVKRSVLGQVNGKVERVQNVQTEEQDSKATRPKVAPTRLKIPNVRPAASKIPTVVYQVAKPRSAVSQVVKPPVASYASKPVLSTAVSTSTSASVCPHAPIPQIVKPIIPPVIIPAERAVQDKKHDAAIDLSSVKENSEPGPDENATKKRTMYEEGRYMDCSQESGEKKRKSEEAVIKTKEDEPEFDEELEFWDTAMAAEYSKDIFEYYCELERKYMPNPSYMDAQNEIEWHMRGILVDWLVQVHARFRLLPETLYLAINLIDRFLSIKCVSLQKLQLVGTAALFIAAKFEEITCPSVHEMVYMVDNGYSAEEILKAERYMLNQLKFEMGWPGPMNFLRRCSKADEYDLQTRTLAKYLIEVTLMDERFLHFPASQCAAAGYYLSRHMLNKGEWAKAHQHYSAYKEEELKPVAAILLEMLMTPKKHEAIYHKYAERSFMKASQFVQHWLINRP